MMAEPRLLESALRRWWVVLIAFAVTTALTVLWVTPKPAVYESAGTYVVQPRTAQGADSVRALEALIRGTQINATYALIARSDAIKDTAEARLASIPENAHLQLEAEAVTGTNALSISARARNPESAHALAVAAGVETIAYVDELQQPYELVLLELPELPSNPVNSRKPLTIVLGALLGLMLGLGIAAITDRIVFLRRARLASTLTAIEPLALEEASAEPALAAALVAPAVTVSPPDPAVTVAPESPAVTGAPSDPPIDLVADARSDPAVQEELVRAADGGATYSLGVVELEPANRHDSSHNGDGNHHDENGAGAIGELAHFEPLLQAQALRNGRTLTYVRDGVFAVVLPDMSAVNASELLSDWLADVSDIDTDDPSAGLLVSMTVVEYTARRAAPVVPEVTP